jgi:cytochrome c oxidase assembly protein Cox11
MTSVTKGSGARHYNEQVSSSFFHSRRFFVSLWLVVLLTATAVSSWLYWRYTAPVTVEIASSIIDLPLIVEAVPSSVQVRPGEVVSVTYRIYNPQVIPLEAYGDITIEPAHAVKQMQLYLSQCGGMNTFQSNLPEMYDVIFRVEPAGLFGSRHLVLRHTFTPATLRH